MTAARCQVARALIAWSQDQLANASKITKGTIAQFEAGGRSPYLWTLRVLRKAREAAGVIFVEENGAGPRSSGLPSMKNWTWRQCQTVLDQPAPSALSSRSTASLLLGWSSLTCRRCGFKRRARSPTAGSWSWPGSPPICPRVGR